MEQYSTVGRRVEFAHGDNNQLLTPAAGFPAITVPMGYTLTTLLAGLQFLGRAWSEPVLLRIAYAHEHASRQRINAGTGVIR